MENFWWLFILPNINLAPFFGFETDNVQALVRLLSSSTYSQIIGDRGHRSPFIISLSQTIHKQPYTPTQPLSMSFLAVLYPSRMLYKIANTSLHKLRKLCCTFQNHHYWSYTQLTSTAAHFYNTFGHLIFFYSYYISISTFLYLPPSSY